MTRLLDFIAIPERSAKPRTKGLTIARDDGLGYDTAKNILENVAEYVDYVKIRHLFVLTAQRDAADSTLRKVQLYRDNDIHVFPGGIVFEISYVQDRYNDYFEAISSRGFDAVECSENIISLGPEERRAAVEAATRCGLTVLYELGDKYPDRIMPVDELVDDINAVVDYGASKVIIERSYTDMLLGPNADQPGQEYVEQLVDKVGLELLTFELESTVHQGWFFSKFGPDVNVGPNLALDTIMKLEPTRRTLSREGGYGWLNDLAEEKAGRARGSVAS